jgi:molybdenum cofactor cytidylyltransferase
MIWAVVLAAGESKRMGQPKMLLPFKESTILETVIRSLLDANIPNVLVVLGAESARLSELLRNYPVQPIYNPNYSQGMLSSVQAGFAALPSEAQSVLVVLGDHPMVSGSIITRLMTASQTAPDSIVLPVYQGRRGHPVLIPSRYRSEIATLSHSVGLRQLLQRNPDAVLEIRVDSPEILQDIDDPQAYQEALSKKEG